MTESQQHTVGALLICFLMIIVSLSTGFVVYKGSIEAGEPNFEILGYDTQADYTNFNYSKKITLDHDQVPGDLTGFPVVINITDDSDMYSHCINNSGYDIVFFNATNETQFSHEIEYWNWDTGNSEVDAYIWVNVSSLTAASDTIMYMYYGYDDTDQQDVAGVWDENYLLVTHMNSSGTSIFDSTSNNNDGTKNGTNDPQEVSSLIGNAQDYDSANTELIIMDNLIAPQTAITLECWFKPESVGIGQDLIADCYDSTTHYNEMPFIFTLKSTNKLSITISDDDDSLIISSLESSTTFGAGHWYHCACTWDNGDSGNAYIYVNGTQDNSDTATGTMASSGARAFTIGSEKDDGVYKNFPNGIIEEVRISDIARSPNWIATTYNSQNNATNESFFTFGPEVIHIEGEGASVYTIKGLPNDKITWAGTAGTTVYCNDTGDTNEWLEINMTINSTDNVTEIRVFIDDLNDSVLGVNASNITLYISSDNSSYGQLGTFTDDGSNLSINDTNWNFATMGDNPFNGTGLTDKNRSIYCIFKLTIPVGVPTDIFFSAATTSYKIYLGHYT